MRLRVGSIKDFEKRPCIKFPIEGNKEGFVVRWKNEFHAYENVCCHVLLPLDYGDGGFFSPDGKFLFCHNHGAEYDPATGSCVRGPCKGASLKRIPVQVEDGAVWVNINKEKNDEKK